MNRSARPIEVITVDDDATTRALIAGLLEQHGVTAAACADGDELRVLLAKMQPQVVILDVQMPGDDGFYLAEELRRRFGLGIAIIMLTSHGRAGDKEIGMGVGVDDYLVKPCDWRQLIAMVHRHLAGTRAQPAC